LNQEIALQLEGLKPGAFKLWVVYLTRQACISDSVSRLLLTLDTTEFQLVQPPTVEDPRVLQPLVDRIRRRHLRQRRLLRVARLLLEPQLEVELLLCVAVHVAFVKAKA
jgi:hypothetical protein